MEEELEPFADHNYEPVEIDGRTTLQLHGEEGRYKKVEADKIPTILEAMRAGWDIDIEYTFIEGNLDIREVQERFENDEDYKSKIKGRINIQYSQLRGDVFLRHGKFLGVVSFKGTEFYGDANFPDTIFCQAVSFEFTEFSGIAAFGGASFHNDVSFHRANFRESADFIDCKFLGSSAAFERVAMGHPARFTDIVFHKNTVFVGLWNLTMAKIFHVEIVVTDFSDLNTNVVMDGTSNPRLKRYIDDEQWIESWRYSGHRGFSKQRPWFVIWELTSHCGRSIGLWAAWSLFFVFLFALAYTPAPDWMPEWWYNFWQEYGTAFEQTTPAYSGNTPGFWSCLYFSIVSFTTLGFGDIVAANWFGRFLVTVEVILGYVMLGGLISIFANKFARRS